MRPMNEMFRFSPSPTPGKTQIQVEKFSYI